MKQIERTMPRLSTIAVDSEAPVPAQWSAAWVQRRLVEAYMVERRMPRTRRPTTNSWPAMQTEWEDLVGRAEEARHEVLDSWELLRCGVSAEEVSKMDAAQDWLSLLKAYPEERMCLARWAAAIAYGVNLSQMLMERGWARTSFYRKVTAGSYIIALELERQGEPVS